MKPLNPFDDDCYNPSSRPKQRGYKVASQEEAQESKQEEAQEPKQEEARESYHTLLGV
jgi:hypothetical protein